MKSGVSGTGTGCDRDRSEKEGERERERGRGKSCGVIHVTTCFEAFTRLEQFLHEKQTNTKTTPLDMNTLTDSLICKC